MHNVFVHRGYVQGFLAYSRQQTRRVAVCWFSTSQPPTNNLTNHTIFVLIILTPNLSRHSTHSCREDSSSPDRRDQRIGQRLTDGRAINPRFHGRLFVTWWARPRNWTKMEERESYESCTLYYIPLLLPSAVINVHCIVPNSVTRSRSFLRLFSHRTLLRWHRSQSLLHIEPNCLSINYCVMPNTSGNNCYLLLFLNDDNHRT